MCGWVVVVCMVLLCFDVYSAASTKNGGHGYTGHGHALLRGPSHGNLRSTWMPPHTRRQGPSTRGQPMIIAHKSHLCASVGSMCPGVALPCAALMCVALHCAVHLNGAPLCDALCCCGVVRVSCVVLHCFAMRRCPHHVLVCCGALCCSILVCSLPCIAEVRAAQRGPTALGACDSLGDQWVTICPAVRLGRSLLVGPRLCAPPAATPICVAHRMWVATTLRGVHSYCHDAHPDHWHC